MPRIEINYLDSVEDSLFKIVPLNKRRDWMNTTTGAFAYHCMPLVIANEYAWGVPAPAAFEAEWNGGQGTRDISVYGEPGVSDWAISHFGNGVLTISVDFVLKTDRGISTYIRGVPNYFKKGIQPLDAIVETDWLPFTFTYNYLFTDPGRVRFEKDEILFSFFPVRRAWVESFDIVEKDIKENQDFYDKYLQYSTSRADHLHKSYEVKDVQGFQKYYRNAKDPEGKSYMPFKHQKQVKLKRPSANQSSAIYVPEI